MNNELEPMPLTIERETEYGKILITIYDEKSFRFWTDGLDLRVDCIDMQGGAFQQVNLDNTWETLLQFSNSKSSFNFISLQSQRLLIELMDRLRDECLSDNDLMMRSRLAMIEHRLDTAWKRVTQLNGVIHEVNDSIELLNKEKASIVASLQGDNQ